MEPVETERDPMEMALSNEVVMDNVLKHLKVIDVLSCREVSKLWNNSASSVLRRRSTMIKKISNEADLMNLEECMKQSSDFPLAGLNFCEPWSLSSGGAMEFFQRYGDRFTRLRLNANYARRLQDLVPFINDLPRLSILEVHPPVILHSDFERPDSAAAPGNGGILRLPSVRTIRLLSYGSEVRVNEEILREVVTAASSSVQIECVDVNPGIVRALQSAGRLRDLSVMKFHRTRFQKSLRTEMNELLSAESPSLTKLDFHGLGCLSSSGLVKILFSSQHTLKELNIDGPWVLKWSWEKFPVLAKLTSFSLRVFRSFWSGSLFHGRHGNKFPALKEFKLDMKTICMRVSLLDDLFIVPSVSTIHINGYINEDDMRKLARSFPNVTEIQRDYERYANSAKYWEGDPPFDIWNVREFKHLEKLRIWNVSVRQPFMTSHTVDSYLTGIPVEICKNLLKHKQLNLNSPAIEVSRDNPCILQLANLKELIVCVKPGRGQMKLSKDTMTMVSVWYALEMMPNLKVKLVYEEDKDKSVLQAAFKNVEPSIKLERFFY